jgi:hypothetical protein
MINVRKKAITLCTALILITAMTSIGLYTMRTSGQAQKQNTSLTLTSPSVERNESVGITEVNREVLLEGNLTGEIGFICEEMRPWNYELQTSEGTVYVFWNGSVVCDSVPVRVYGVFANLTLPYDPCQSIAKMLNETYTPPTWYCLVAEKVEFI